MKALILLLSLTAAQAHAFTMSSAYLDAACEGAWPSRYVTAKGWAFDCKRNLFVPVGNYYL